MTGKTHMAISAATVATALYVTGVRASAGLGYLLPPDLVEGNSIPYVTAGLMLVGLVAGLFPDLDAPDTELQHLPRRATNYLGRSVTAALGGHAPLSRWVRKHVLLIALPFTLVVSAVGAALRASTHHRGFTHTLLGALLFTGLSAGVTLFLTGSTQWAWAIGIVWLLGYASHLAADACTPSGIPLFGVPDRLIQAPVSGNSSRSSRSANRTRWQALNPNSDALARGAHSYHGAHMFHLLPKGLRVRTGTPIDTLLIRGVAWTVCAFAVTPMLLT